MVEEAFPIIFNASSLQEVEIFAPHPFIVLQVHEKWKLGPSSCKLEGLKIYLSLFLIEVCA